MKNVDKIFKISNIFTKEEQSLIKNGKGDFFSGGLGTIIQFIEHLDKGPELNIIDFDSTLSSRTEQLKIEGFKNNRGYLGNIWLLAHYGGIIDSNNHVTVSEETIQNVKKMTLSKRKNAYKQYVNQFYDNSKIIDNKDELIKLDINNSGINLKANLILTTGDKYLQKFKLHNTGLSYIPHLVVENTADKVKMMILYIINLGYIPEKINIFEDKTKFFDMYGKISAKVLKNTISVNKVEINDKLNIAEIIKTNTYKN